MNRCSHPMNLNLWGLPMFAVLTGCMGSVALDENSSGKAAQSTYAVPCTDPDRCCPSGSLVCSNDPDGAKVCGCAELWECSKNATKCQKAKPTPSGSGDWTCTWTESEYTCSKPGSVTGEKIGSDWDCSQLGNTIVCSSEVINPNNTEAGADFWRCYAENTNSMKDQIVCSTIPVTSDSGLPFQFGPYAGAPKADSTAPRADTTTPPPPPPPPPPCVPGPEICANGQDENCNGLVDEAPCTCLSFQDVDCAAIGEDPTPDCNNSQSGHYDSCMQQGSGNCTQDQLHNWCSRTGDESSTWMTLSRQWVEQRCGSAATLGDHEYSCQSDVQCKRFTCGTPLVLSFNPAQPVEFTANRGQETFDFSSAQDGSISRTDWPSLETPWLARDRNNDGVISSARELFGSATEMSGGMTARHGFAALSALDGNGDGRIDVKDEGFSQLRLWYDYNGNRVSDQGELRTLKELGVISLELSYFVAGRCDLRANCEKERSRFTWQDQQGRLQEGAVIDVYLSQQHP
jgi:hypothetical protein